MELQDKEKKNGVQKITSFHYGIVRKKILPGEENSEIITLCQT